MYSRHSATQFTYCKLPYVIHQIIGEHTCEGKSKDKSIGFADNQQHYDSCLVNSGPLPTKSASAKEKIASLGRELRD
jgi:hypothetical protein